MTLDIDEMTIKELKDIVKMLARNLNHEHERINILQERLLKIEMKSSSEC